ncbi:MAG: hypothetical protein NUV45_14525 [Tepidanaerobacteraceae bacterium]|jgi:hypothetical protein|nr:hypothetical protein [Tepidanaerobacteraceae bacterium]
MKKLNLIKLLLDVLMTAVFTLMFNKMAIAGLYFHEVAGLSLGAAFVVHKALNWKWITQITKKLFSHKSTYNNRTSNSRRCKWQESIIVEAEWRIRQCGTLLGPE